MKTDGKVKLASNSLSRDVSQVQQDRTAAALTVIGNAFLEAEFKNAGKTGLESPKPTAFTAKFQIVEEPISGYKSRK